MVLQKVIKLFMVLICIGISTVLHSQNKTLQVKILNKNTKKPLKGAHVCIGEDCVVSDLNGIFTIEKVTDEKRILIISFIGYKPYIKEIVVSEIPKIIYLKPKSSKLEEVVIKGVSTKRKLQRSVLSKVAVEKDFLDKNRDNSLMQTLQILPGISTVSIGSGQSKPVIRGLGFNRVVVAENGIKHEAQQWGADHGLEIDQNNAEEIEITKGASSLLYGSDAIAGIISIKTNKLQSKNTLLGEVRLNSQSNNQLLEATVGVKQRFKKWFYKARISHKDFADYKVPTNKIYYENYVFDLHKNYLRNTAGLDNNASIALGYTSDNFFNETTISNVNSKNGFFANAHGLEVRVSTIDYDANSRDVDLPYHKVNHFKVINNSKFYLSNHTLSIDAGFQKNHREEHSEPTAHGHMPKPPSTKERLFLKNTYSLNVKSNMHLWNKHKPAIGINLEYQDNTIGGWGFLIPAYNRFTAGIFLYNQYKINHKTYLEGGFRYDYGNINTKEYYEWFYSPVTDKNGNVSQQKLQRAKAHHLQFGSYSASFGISHLLKRTSYKLNIGKSFRIPLANELASNGVNYHMYRYEEGNVNLKPESSYQIDGEFDLRTTYFSLNINPFLNYFDNYIYLNPSSEYYETLQKYQYTQSKVFRYGGEIIVDFTPVKNLLLSSSLEYVKSKQLSGSKKNFTLPFSPPLSTVFSVKYNINQWHFLKNIGIFTNVRITAKQNEIVPPEKPTDGYTKIDAGLHTEIPFVLKKHPLKFQFKVNNILNQKIFNHTSFYRLIEVPEAGRNFSITLTQNF